jgi:hypothetical protein
MKRLLQITGLIFISLTGFAQDNKEEAKRFFQSIVKTYFDKECDKLYSFLNDTISIVSPYGEEILPSKMMAETRKICDKFDEFTADLVSFQQYIDEYKIIVLSKSEFTSKNNDSVTKLVSVENTGNLMVYEILQELNTYYTDDDLLVFGNVHKSNNNKNLNQGLFWLIVRKTKNGWKIFGTKA